MSKMQKTKEPPTEEPELAQEPRMPVVQSANGAAIGQVVRMAEPMQSAEPPAIESKIEQ